MTDFLSRAFTGDLAIRADSTGRTICGIVVPFERVARVSDGGPAYDEAFQRGAFTKTIAERGDRVKLLMQHNAHEPIGRAITLREDAAGLYGEFAVSRVAAGDEALELVRDGVIDSFSVGFRPIKHTRREGVTWRTEVGLRESSLVTFPAYEDARLAGIRAAFDALPESEREAFLAMWASARDLTTATTADGQTEREHDTTDEPASATQDVMSTHRSLRALARERGIL